jgi:signal peptidase II
MAKKKSFPAAKSSSVQPAPWLGIAAIVILLDQITKITITQDLFSWRREVRSPRSSTWCWPTTRARRSASCQRGGWQRYFFTAIGIGAALFIIYLLKKHAGQRLFCWALALIMGGAIGNVIDRVLYGHVIDFLDFHFPASATSRPLTSPTAPSASAPPCSSSTSCGA